MANLKFAFRRLFKTPFVTIVAILSLALGIGANAAIFSLVNEVLLARLPVPEPDRLVNLSAPGPKPGSQSCGTAGNCSEVFSYAMYRDLDKIQTVFTGIALHVGFGANVAFSGQTESVRGMFVSGNYFRVLGLTPALGRLLDANDDRVTGEAHVAVLDHAYWQKRFGENPAVLNQTMIVNGQPMTIVGVAPRGFDGTTLGIKPAVFVPVTMKEVLQSGWKGLSRRQTYWAYLFARLRPGVSIEQARASLNAQYHAIVNDVEAPLQKGMSDQTMAKFRAKPILVESGKQGQSNVRGEARTPLNLLLGVTALVLVIACANIANLLLARAAARANEMAIRLSIGANRRQLVVQLLVESLMLAVLGGLAGLVVAHWTLNFIASLLPAEDVVAFRFGLDPAVLAFAAAVTLGTGILFGLFPALHSTRPDLASTLKGIAGQPSGARGAARFRTVLATAQIALSLMLLVAAGLFTKSLFNVSRVDLGVKIDNVITFGVSPKLNGYSFDRAMTFFKRLEDELAAVPGVTGVTASLVPLLAGDNWGNDVSVQGFTCGPDTDCNSRFNEVGPGYFRTLGVPLIAGREFTSADEGKSRRVVIVNEAFLQKFGLGRDAVGKLIGERGGKLDTEIVGIVQNAKYSEVKDKIPPLYFRPYRQDDNMGSLSFYVRSSLPLDQTLAAVRPAVARLDPNLPVEDLRSMPQQVRDNVCFDRFMTLLSAAFASLATLLAAIGLYGVLAYTVAQRTREIGLRMALGAAPGRVRGMVLRQVGWMTLVGGIIGLAAAVAVGRAARSLFYQLEWYDPSALAAGVVLLSGVALLAGFIPAHRASRIDPMTALRYE